MALKIRLKKRYFAAAVSSDRPLVIGKPSAHNPLFCLVERSREESRWRSPFPLPALSHR